LKKRLFIYTTLIIFTGLLCFFIASIFITQNNNLSMAKDTVMETARIFADLYTEGASLKPSNDTRLTVIAPDGRVIADSRPLDLGAVTNHLDRPEIQAALSGSPAAHVRYSDTLGVDLIYYALKVDSGDSYVFIRAAIPVARVDAYMIQSLPLLILILCVVVLLCFAFSRGMIGRITRPFVSVEQKLRLLSSGGYTPEPMAESYEEIDAMLRGIDEVAQVLQGSLTSLQDEKAKAEYILNNIGDGIFAVDESKSIVLVNNAALDMFDVTPDIAGKGLNYLSYDKALTGAIGDCISHDKNSLFELALNGRIYLVTIKRLPGTMLTMGILSDVTDSRENAKRREEFFANASHELKTPLTAIKGFNELTALNNKDEGIQKYVDSITRETDRMLSLIGDMLKLSELEQRDAAPNGVCGRGTEVSLKAVADEVRETLSTAISEKSIAFEIIGDSMVEAEPEHIYELVKNLAENAVRYNEQGGSVTVKIDTKPKAILLTVSDTGIGISPGEQSRIFERFYRVEKSRSIRSGGTGLGLSIVKHICALYDWKLSLKSKPGVGTEVTVVF
jgi:two-component system phosphate regulon sensor histidine kinase PhoR